MKVILDTNIWISFLLSKQDGLLNLLLTNKHFDIYVCKELLDEIKDVSLRPKIKKYIGKQDINILFDIISAFCYFDKINKRAKSKIRDKKDLYLLSFAESIDAMYIISGDKDLITLQSHKQIKIITLTEFKKTVLQI